MAVDPLLCILGSKKMLFLKIVTLIFTRKQAQIIYEATAKLLIICTKKNRGFAQTPCVLFFIKPITAFMEKTEGQSKSEKINISLSFACLISARREKNKISICVHLNSPEVWDAMLLSSGRRRMLVQRRKTKNLIRTWTYIFELKIFKSLRNIF